MRLTCRRLSRRITESNANGMVGTGRSSQTRLGEMEQVVIHDNREYGISLCYMRLRKVPVLERSWQVRYTLRDNSVPSRARRFTAWFDDPIEVL